MGSIKVENSLISGFISLYSLFIINCRCFAYRLIGEKSKFF